MFSNGHIRSGLLNGMASLNGLKFGTAQLDGALARRLDNDARKYLALCNPKPSMKWTKALNTFIVNLKQQGNWPQFDRLWIFAADYRQNARISIVNPETVQNTEVNNPAWTKNEGYTGNGAGAFINTNFTASLNGVNFTQNSASMGVYCNSASLTGSVEVDFGSQNGTIMTQYWAPTLTCYVNSGSPVGGQPYTKGMVASVRTSSSVMSAWINGIQVSSGSYASTGISTSPTYIMTQDLSNAPQSGVYSTRQYAMFFCGGGGISQHLLYNSFKNFLNNI